MAEDKKRGTYPDAFSLLFPTRYNGTLCADVYAGVIASTFHVMSVFSKVAGNASEYF